jgi:hypothetical protein
MTEQQYQLNPTSGLAELRQKRHAQGRDLKVVITQRNSETGGGKTTLAVFLALSWDVNGWDGEQKGTVDPEEFLNIYPELPEHSCIIMDEAEELDARRSMASENVEFSKHWMTMRTRQIDSILTLPATSALDKRLLELADVRINVKGRGKGSVYRIKIDDHNPERGPQEWHMHEIEWPDLSEHPEYQKLDAQKQQMIDEVMDEEEEDDEQTPKDLADFILANEGVEKYYREINGGAQVVLDHDFIADEYDLSERGGKKVKKWLKKEVGGDVV